MKKVHINHKKHEGTDWAVRMDHAVITDFWHHDLAQDEVEDRQLEAQPGVALFDTALFKKMNILFE